MMSGSSNFSMLFQIKDSPACIVFSLFSKRSIDTHSEDEDVKPHHDHKHQDVCEQCLSLFLTIEAVEKLAVAVDDIELRQELLYDIKLSGTYIIEWMCHVLRGVQQEKAKLYAISQLDPSCGFWLLDWDQKVIQCLEKGKEITSVRRVCPCMWMFS